jgi:AcrR family transcriptional regulator
MTRSAAAPVPRAPRRRRSQEERSAATRAKVLAAAVECLSEQGFRAATMGAIAARAGVSFGAIQHQFGEKDAVFDGVLEQAVERLQANLAGLREEFPDPSARVRAFVARYRQISNGHTYRAFVEIQLHRARERSEAREAWSLRVARELAALFTGVFGDLGLSRRRLADAERFTFAVLSGIATETMLFPDADFSARHFAILEDTLLRLLDLA